MIQVVWVALALVILVCAVNARASTRALRIGLRAVAALYLGAGALVNAVYVVGGEDYADFAEQSSFAFVRDTWASLVVPHHHFFLWLLVAFEAAVGLLVLLGGRWTTWGLVAAIGFHVALLSFGWGYLIWVVPLLAALSLLLRAHLERQHPPGAAGDGARRSELAGSAS